MKEENECKTCQKRIAYENAIPMGNMPVMRPEKPDCGKCIADRILNNVFGSIPNKEQFDPLV